MIDFFKSFTKKLVFICILFSCLTNIKAQVPQGQRPTTFPDLQQLSDSTLFFTQDSVSQQSYKFTLGKLKSYIGKSTCLDSTFSNTNDCIPERQTKNGDSIYYHNTFGEIFGDTSGTIQFCDAINEFPNLISQAVSVDGNTFNTDSTMYCSTGYEGGYSFSQDFPVDVRLCQNGYIKEIRVRAFISYYDVSGSGQNPGIAVLTLNVNGQNVNTANPLGNGTPPNITILGNFNGTESYEFIYNNIQASTINSVRATFMWLNRASFHLDGLKVTYKIADCPCYQRFITTDSLGCMKLDSVILPEPFTLDATNGLSTQNDNTVKLGGNINSNTSINGNGNQLQFNGFNNIQLNSYYYDDNNPNINSSSNFQQSGNYSSIQTWRGDNNNNTNESSGYSISPNYVSQYYNFYNNSNNISKYSENYVSDYVNQSSSYSDNTNGIYYSSSSQMTPSGYYLYNNSNSGEYSNHTLNSQNILFNSYGINNDLTTYSQTKNEIGIKATDYSLGITQLKLSPLSVYIQTHKIYSNSATLGQVLTLKDISTGEVEFEDFTTTTDTCANGITGNGTINHPIKLGGNISENTIISVDTSSMFSIGKYVGGYMTIVDSFLSIGVNTNNALVHPVQMSFSSKGELTIGRSDNINNTSKDYLNIKYDDINSKLDLEINELPSNNTASQLLAKDSNGFSVWRDVSSIKPYSYTPTSSTDTFGNLGDVAYDDDYVYVRTSAGWKRTSLGTW